MLTPMIWRTATQKAPWPMSLQPEETIAAHALGFSMSPIEPTRVVSLCP